MKIRYTYCLLIALYFGVTSNLFAQNEVEENAKTSIKSGNAKQLSNNFNDTVEISFDGQKQSYSKTQAEFVVRDFFKKYPVTDFDYIHQGSSKEGLKYIIGKYKHAGGSFRVYMLIKQFKGKYLIDTLDFSAE
jgi:hypothetical protein